MAAGLRCGADVANGSCSTAGQWIARNSRPLSLPAAGNLPHQSHVYGAVDKQHPHADQDLYPRGKPGWIDQRHQVVLHERALVSGTPRHPSEPVLQPGQGTEPPRQLYPRTPCPQPAGAAMPGGATAVPATRREARRARMPGGAGPPGLPAAKIPSSIPAINRNQRVVPPESSSLRPLLSCRARLSLRSEIISVAALMMWFLVKPTLVISR